MGLLDRWRRRDAVRTTKSALEAAKDPDADDGVVMDLVRILLDAGLDGIGPIDSATQVAGKARRYGTDVDGAIDKVVRSHIRNGTVGGFVTSVGGFATMPVALPANVLEFYVQATRMVGAIATLRGYDVKDPQVRTAVLLTLAGVKADDVLSKAGLGTGVGRVTTFALRRLPPAALMMVNKAIGFRLLRGVGERFLTKLGRGIPVVGGLVGAAIDGRMMKRVADQARKEFPPLPPARVATTADRPAAA